MEDQKTYPDIEKINVDIKTCPIKPMDSCPLLIAAIVEMTPKTDQLYYQGLCICTNRFKIIGNKIKVTTTSTSINLCYIILLR